MINRQTKQSAGADLSASIETIIPAGKIALVPTGFDLLGVDVYAPNTFFLLTARSSLAYKTGLLLANSVGVIDSD